MKLLALIVGTALFATIGRAGELKDLDVQLRDQAPKILKLARDKKAGNIGVLKFMVQVGDGKATDNVGPLNSNLAERLTVALVMALPDDSIGIIGNANEVLAKNKAVMKHDDASRARLFRTPGFQLAWGPQKDSIAPELFVTGVAHLSSDLKTVTVKLHAFGDDGALDESLGEFTARTSTQTLIDTGHRYVFTKERNPKMFGSRGVPREDAEAGAIDLSKKFSAEQRDGSVPDIDIEAPIRVALIYDGNEVAVKDGVAPTPNPGAKLAIRIENRDKEETYGVVVKINGDNTIFGERFPDRDCMKWILEPGKGVTITGFQKDDKEMDPFEIVKDVDPRVSEMRFREHFGTIQVTAFRSVKPDEKTKPPVNNTIKPPIVEEQKSVAAIARGSLSVEGVPPHSLETLQDKLRGIEPLEPGSAKSKGIAIPSSGKTEKHKVVRVTFTADTEATMSYPIRYYKLPGK